MLSHIPCSGIPAVVTDKGGQCHSKKQYQQNAQQKQYRYLLQFQYVIKQHTIIIHIYHNLDV